MLKNFKSKKSCISSLQYYGGGLFVVSLFSTFYVQAVEFGDIRVASGLSQPFNAVIAVTGADANTQVDTCFTARVTSTGGTGLADVTIGVTPTKNGAALRLYTVENIVEPAVLVVLENKCGGSLRREFTVLLDPPISQFPATAERSQARAEFALPGPSSAAMHGPHGDERLRRFIAAKQSSDPSRIAKKMNGSSAEKTVEKIAEHAPDSAQPTAPAETLVKRSAFRMAPYEESSIDVMPGGLKLTRTDQITTRITPLELTKKATATKVLAVMPAMGSRQENPTQNVYGDTKTSVLQMVPLIGGVLFFGFGLFALVSARATRRRQQPIDWHWQQNQDQKLEKSTLQPSLPSQAPSTTSSEIGARPSAQTTPVVQDNTFSEDGLASTQPLSEDLHFPEKPGKSSGAEEISDVMEEAEFWMSLRNTRRAAEVLEPYANTDDPGTPLSWLYLFKLYLEMDNRDKYDALRERFHLIFNAHILDWNDQVSADTTAPERTISDVAQLKEKIIELWETDGILPYLEGLLLDDRQGSRMGFTLSIFHEIMFLINLARTKRDDHSADTNLPPITSWAILDKSMHR